MAVVSVNETFLPGEDGNRDQSFKKEYKRVFVVVTNALSDGIGIVGSDPRIPRIGTFYVESTSGFVDLGAFCVKVTPKRRDSFVWDVECDYTTFGPSAGEGGSGTGTGSGMDPSRFQDLPPLQRPSDIHWGIAKFQRPTHRAWDPGAPTATTPDIRIVNAAGALFEPALEIDDTRLTLVIERNEATYVATSFSPYFDTINSDTFLGFSAWKVKCEGITAIRDFQHGQFFHRVRYEFHIREDTWRVDIANRGTVQKITVPLLGEIRAVIRDKRDGSAFTEGVNLDANGAEQAPNLPVNYLTFFPYRPRPFAPLNLP